MDPKLWQDGHRIFFDFLRSLCLPQDMGRSIAFPKLWQDGHRIFFDFLRSLCLRQDMGRRIAFPKIMAGRTPNLFRFSKKFMSSTGYGKKYRLRKTKTFRGTPTWELVCPNGNILDYHNIYLSSIEEEVKQWVFKVVGS